MPQSRPFKGFIPPHLRRKYRDPSEPREEIEANNFPNNQQEEISQLTKEIKASNNKEAEKENKTSSIINSPSNEIEHQTMEPNPPSIKPEAGKGVDMQVRGEMKKENTKDAKKESKKKPLCLLDLDEDDGYKTLQAPVLATTGGYPQMQVPLTPGLQPHMYDGQILQPRDAHSPASPAQDTKATVSTGTRSRPRGSSHLEAPQAHVATSQSSQSHAAASSRKSTSSTTAETKQPVDGTKKLNMTGVTESPGKETGITDAQMEKLYERFEKIMVAKMDKLYENFEAKMKELTERIESTTFTERFSELLRLVKGQHTRHQVFETNVGDLMQIINELSDKVAEPLAQLYNTLNDINKRLGEHSTYMDNLTNDTRTTMEVMQYNAFRPTEQEENLRAALDKLDNTVNSIKDHDTEWVKIYSDLLDQFSKVQDDVNRINRRLAGR